MPRKSGQAFLDEIAADSMEKKRETQNAIADAEERIRELRGMIALTEMASAIFKQGEPVNVADLLARDRALKTMWPEACRRAGVELVDYPHDLARKTFSRVR